MAPLPKIFLLTFHIVSFCTLVAAQSDYWLANIRRQGVVPYGNDTSYPVFRNVKESYGGVPGAVGESSLSVQHIRATDTRFQVMGWQVTMSHRISAGVVTASR